MQPYQEATESIRRQSEMPFRAAGAALGTAASLFGASGVLGKVAPWLSQYVPESMAIKGLSKVDKRLGSFIKKAMADGYDFNEVKNFIGEKLDGAKQEVKIDEKNIVEKYSPELHNFIQKTMGEGRSALEAGALASLEMKGGKGFKGVIDKLVKDYKTPWSSILESVYGTQQKPQQTQQQQVQQPQVQQGAVGPGQQALMDILKEINSRRGR